ncbi:uncharacterized protein ACJ7VT_003101 [Polymixia lowei]
MHPQVVIFALSFLTTSAYPLHRDSTSREAAWADPKSNQAHDKTELTKNIDVKVYKSYVDSSDLYAQEDNHSQNPMVEEMRRKLSMESERLGARLRHELAELRERLSPHSAHPGSALVSMRERLAPLTQQLQSSVSSNIQELRGQLNLYLQGLETAEGRAEPDPALYREAFHWISRTLEHSGSKLADIISDFQTKSVGVINQMRETSARDGEETDSGLWQEMSTRLGQEVSSMRVEAQGRVGALKDELAALLATAQPLKAEATASIDRFCQSAALQSQVFQARIERLLLRLEEEVKELQEAPSLPSFSSSIQPSGSLQEDFSAKLSALIQDILHSVQ